MTAGPILTEGNLVDGRYRILHLIGGGATGRVYKVRHREQGTVHALKELPIPDEEGSRPAFIIDLAEREARYLSMLSHPSLPKVTDFFHENGCAYLVMDFIEGQSLGDFLDKQGDALPDVPTVLGWGIEVCKALVYLHNQIPPIIYRDLKPSNLILRPDGGITIVDFGIARNYRKGAASDTVVFGSPGYSPPEQYGQAQTDARSDLYALGATLHHLLTGRDPSFDPFKWPPVRSLNPTVPLIVDKLIMQCLEMEPARRLDSAETVGRSLRTALVMLEEADRPLSAGASLPAASWQPERPLALHGDPFGMTAPAAVADLPEIEASAPPRPPRAKPKFTTAGAPPLPMQDRFAVRAGTLAPLSPPREGSAPPVVSPEKLRRALLVSALVVLIGGATLPIWSGWLAPTERVTAAPVKPAAQASRAAREGYRQQEIAYRTEAAHAQAAVAAYQSLSPLRSLLDLVVCLAFFFGVVRPLRPLRHAMTLTIGGIFGLIFLTGALFLPARLGLFIALAVLEAALLIPAALLFTADNT